MSTSTKRFQPAPAAAVFARTQRPRIDARQRRDAATGAGVGLDNFAQGILPSTVQLAPSSANDFRPGGIVHPEPLPLPTPAYIKACTELVRIAIALHLGLLIRLWLVMSEMARETNATGFTRKEIKEALQRYNVKFSGRNLSRWLNIGLADGVFWTYDTRTKRYYHRGYESLVRSMIDECDRAGREYLYITNYPGQRKPMLINVASDNLKQFEAFAYGAWVASRENLIISRINLLMLWGRTSPILRTWETTGAVDVMANYAYCDETNHDAIPRNEDGTWRADVHRTTLNGRDVLAWQLPNAYTASVTQHPGKGQLRTTYSRLKRYVETSQAASVCEQGGDAPGGRNRNVKRYHQSNKGARNSFALHGERDRYVFKGRWNTRYGYFEYTPTGTEQFDYWQLRRLFRRLQCVCFTKRG